MKAIFCSLLITLFFSSNIFGQIGFGIKAGPSYSNINIKFDVGPLLGGAIPPTDDPDDRNSILRFHAGFFFNKTFEDRFTLEVNALYSLEGYEFIDPNFGNDGRIEFHNISLPISLGYQIFPKTTISLGPDLSYLVSSREKTDSGNFDVSDFFSKRFSVRGLVGINYAFTEQIEIDFRYIHGLTILNGETETIILDLTGTALGFAEIEFRSRVFQLSMRYKI